MEFCHSSKAPSLNDFPLKTLKLGRVAFHSVTFQLKCLDFQSNQIRNSSQSSHVSTMGYEAEFRENRHTTSLIAACSYAKQRCQM